MKREYYDRTLGIFLCGLIAGMFMLCIFMALRKYGYENLAWILMGSSSGMLCAAYGMSRVLNDIHALDEREFSESSGVVVLEPESTPLLIAEAGDLNEAVPVGALTFPYATKALEAARQATVKFWTEYDPERPPLQKSVQSYIAERGIPVRQAAELASAIKPDNVSDRSDTSLGK